MLRQFSSFAFLIMLVGSVGLPGCTEDQLLDMESFERNLMLSWIAVNRKDGQQLSTFNAAAQREWSTIVRSYGNHLMRPELRDAAVRVGFWMPMLNDAVAAVHFPRATMLINLIQNELRVLRSQYGIRQPADDLYDFYFQWQDVVAASNDPMICLLEWSEYEERVDMATRTWQSFITTNPRFSSYLFPGYGRNAQNAEAGGVAISQKLSAFVSLLDQSNHTLAAEPSRKIDTLFFDYLITITAYPEADAGPEPLQ